MIDHLIEFYLDYLNNFLTIERFSEYHDIAISDCTILVALGRKYHQINTGG